jgi:deoxyribonuclease-4
MLASTDKLMLAPAMNIHMWENPATQANLSILEDRGVQVVLPVSGRLACGDVGEGKLADVDDIVEAALGWLGSALPEQDLAGRRVVVTAGPTHEAIDPVRYIANRSSGKMGYAIASALASHGALVTLVSGPTSLPAPEGCDVVRVTSASEMHDAALAAFEDADAAICSAAVADYTPAHPADHKLKKGVEPLDEIELVQTADILADLSAAKGSRTVIGFAAETSDAVAHASDKLKRKGCDLIVANDVSRTDSGFSTDTDKVAFVSASGVEELPTLTKAEVAERLVQRLAEMLDEQASKDDAHARLTIGPHLSISDGYEAIARTAASIGATTFAYFTRNPRGGSMRALDLDDINAMNDFVREHGFGMLVAHAPYTYNLCSPKPDVREFARTAMREDLERLEYVESTYYNFHPGSHVGQGADEGIRLIAEGLREVMWPGMRTCVLLETMAGKGTEVGRSFEELERIIEAVGDDVPLGVCLDTCHVSDAGYDIIGDLDGVLDEFDRVIGLDRLKALHVNDSKNPAGSHKDRHEKIGQGTLGIDTFAAVVTNPRTRDLPMILETPNELDGRAAEIALLRGLAGEDVEGAGGDE